MHLWYNLHSPAVVAPSECSDDSMRIRHITDNDRSCLLRNRSTAKRILVPLLFFSSLLLFTFVLSLNSLRTIHYQNLQKFAHELPTNNYTQQSLGGSEIDYFTDCVSLSIFQPPANDESNIATWLQSRAIFGCLALTQFVEAKAVLSEDESGEYSRFWHGYSVVTVPLFALGGYALLRSTTVALLILALIKLVVMLERQLRGAGTLVALPLVTMPNENLYVTFSHSFAVLLPIGFSLFLVGRYRSSQNENILGISYGVLLGFSVFLLYPALQVGVPVLVLGVMHICRVATTATIMKEQFKLVARILLGYSLMWATKITISLTFGVSADGARIQYVKWSKQPIYGEALLDIVQNLRNNLLPIVLIPCVAYLTSRLLSRTLERRIVVVALIPAILSVAYWIGLNGHLVHGFAITNLYGLTGLVAIGLAVVLADTTRLFRFLAHMTR